jgi:two-component system, OmpR family, catabolic regulation response regulator CreB
MIDMVKPFSPRELAARVRVVLRWTQPDNRPLPRSPTAPLFQVDPPKRRIHFCGQLLSLSRFEYDILDLLISGTAFYFLTYGFLGIIRTR